MIAHLKALGTMGHMAVQTGVGKAEAAQKTLVQEEATDAAAKTKGVLAMVPADAAARSASNSEGQAIEIDRATVRHSKVLHACMQLWEL
jgi:hypothetical protein